MGRELHDHYFRRAKREGYRSRSAYKLIEIDQRKNVLAKGDRVLDCGAAPGGWLQVAAEKVGPQGRVVGIDRTPIAGGLPGHVHTIADDLTTTDPGELLGDLDGFDVILSDLAPATSGDHTIDHHRSVRLCSAVLERCPALLRPGGRLVMKVFEGEAYPDLLTETKSAFRNVKGYKPPASRDESTEMYIIAEGYCGAAAPTADREKAGEREVGDAEAAIAPPNKPKPRGWGEA